MEMIYIKPLSLSDNILDRMMLEVLKHQDEITITFKESWKI